MTQRIYITGTKNEALNKNGAMQHIADKYGISTKTVANYLMGKTAGKLTRDAVIAYVKENYECDIITIDDNGEKSVE